MVQLSVSARANPVIAGRAIVPRTAVFALAMGTAGLVAGSALSLAMSALEGMRIPGQTWRLPVFDAPVVPFVGVPVVLAAGWTMLALWHLDNRRWLLGGLVAAMIGLAVAATAGLAPLSGMSGQFASALGVLEALVAGVLGVDQHGYIKSQGVLVGLAADIWILMGVLVLFSGSLLLTPILSVAMGAIVASPLLAVAVVYPGEVARDRRSGRASTLRAKAGPILTQSLLWLLVGLFALPLGLMTSYLVASNLFPF